VPLPPLSKGPSPARWYRCPERPWVRPPEGSPDHLPELWLWLPSASDRRTSGLVFCEADFPVPPAQGLSSLFPAVPSSKFPRWSVPAPHWKELSDEGLDYSSEKQIRSCDSCRNPSPGPYISL